MDSGFAKIKGSLITQKKGRRRPTLTTAEKTEIVYQAVFKMNMVKEIAKKHRVSVATVTMLVSKANESLILSKNYMQEMKTGKRSSNESKQLLKR